VTFTNKAANEMRERLTRLMATPDSSPPDGPGARDLVVGTFHSICSRVLRREAARDALGIDHNFSIYDDDDQMKLVKQILEELNLDPKQFSPRMIHGHISNAKNDLLGPLQFQEHANRYTEEIAARVYKRYDQVLRERNAVDFDDLILLTHQLWRRTPDVLAKYQRRYRYIHVDEFQDTNKAQYELVRLLALGTPETPSHRNICVVGDDDQCLVEGTLITMADGAERPIEQVASGYMVRSAYGSGTFGAARVLSATRRERGDGVAITLRSGHTLVSTPEHTHFAGYRLGVAPQLHVTHLMRTRGGGFRSGTSQTPTRGQEKPVVGFMPRAEAESLSLRRLLAPVGLSIEQPQVLPRSHDSNWRHLIITLCADRRANTPLHHISLVGNDTPTREALESIGLSVRTARAGANRWRFEAASASMAALLATAARISEVVAIKTLFTARLGQSAEPGATTSLPFTPALAVRHGMVMFDAQGGYDLVTKVERVTLEAPVYDLDIEATHNFIANGIITHNSIYGWRNAIPEVVRDFQRDFPGARTVLLEQNYRS
ncbi:MAG: UvrD-helicase domain-containing protein, partial [Ktedonobacterales bacterium]